MKLKTGQVINAYQWLVEMKKKDLPYTVAFILSTNAQNMEAVVKSFHEQYQSMIEKYANKDDDGEPKTDNNGFVIFADEDSQQKEITKLTETEVEVTINVIPTDAMGEMRIPIEKMAIVQFMFECPSVKFEQTK